MAGILPRLFFSLGAKRAKAIGFLRNEAAHSPWLISLSGTKPIRFFSIWSIMSYDNMILKGRVVLVLIGLMLNESIM